MKKCWLVAIVTVFFYAPLLAAPKRDTTSTETTFTLHTPKGDIIGTLTIPGEQPGNMPVVLIIAGSGPTDRDGNTRSGKSTMMRNESLKLLAHGLASNNIASLRFDKRGIGESMTAGVTEADLRFEDYINDARSWIDTLKKDHRFNKVFVAGHSEGSLIGMIAAHKKADGFVSIAGAGRSADKILKEQLAAQPAMIKDSSYPIIDSLVMGKIVQHVPKILFALFRPSVQPYMISWFHYDPQTEIKKLTVPVLLIQGTNDLQVTVDDANLLSKSHPKAQLVLIKNMNHVLRIVEGDRKANLATYITADPISTELVTTIATFVHRK